MDKSGIIAKINEIKSQIEFINDELNDLVEMIDEDYEIESEIVESGTTFFGNGHIEVGGEKAKDDDGNLSCAIEVVRKINGEAEFADYLRGVRHLSESSIEGYLHTLRKLRVELEELYSIAIPFEIYEISDVSYVRWVNDLFEDSKKLEDENLKQHHIISAAIHNYINYVEHLQGK